MNSIKMWRWVTLVVMVWFVALGSGALADDNVITIGFSGPLSGGGPEFGKNLQMGLEMAVDQVNKMGGLEVAIKSTRCGSWVSTISSRLPLR